MIDIENMSKIGFGTYRVSLDNSENIDAFNYAIDNGCNLVDTASTYNDAELFIGKYISENADQDLFIVTKAGYLTPDFIDSNGALIAKLNKDINTDFTLINHCIHPDFLEVQINNSLKKLGRKYIDAFLIHNPEKYLENFDYDARIEAQITQSFELLEKMRKKGLIRFYGLSSNVIQFDTYREMDLSINIYLKILRNSPGLGEGFKFIQFPYNLEERDASIALIDDKSLIDMAKENGLITLSNRPFSMHTNNKFIRIQDVQEKVAPIYDDHSGYTTFNILRSSLSKKLHELDASMRLEEFPIFNVMEQGWDKFANMEAVDELFDQEFVELFNVMYDYDIPGYINGLISGLRKNIIEATGYNLKRNSFEYKENFYKQNSIHDGEFSFNHHACASYFNSGIDHVLVGMTKKKYVEQLKMLF